MHQRTIRNLEALGYWAICIIVAALLGCFFMLLAAGTNTVMEGLRYAKEQMGVAWLAFGIIQSVVFGWLIALTIFKKEK